MHKIWVIHGPNLNLLGKREPDRYGRISLETINTQLTEAATHADIRLECYQHNGEHDLIELVHQAPEASVDCILFNPAAFTHTSIALRDALLGVGTPFIEIHISNIYQREPFRHHSYFSDIALGVICGFGVQSYQLALQAAIPYLNHLTMNQ